MLPNFITLLQQLKPGRFDAKKARLFPQCLHKPIWLDLCWGFLAKSVTNKKPQPVWVEAYFWWRRRELHLDGNPLIKIALMRLKICFCYLKKRATPCFSVFQMDGLDGLERQCRGVFFLAQNKICR